MKAKEIKRKISFVLNGTRVAIDSRIEPMQNRTKSRTVDLKPTPKTAKELSICGEFDGSSGQCGGSIREAANGFPAVVELCDIWDRWHLNGMKAGTTKQQKVLESVTTSDYIAQEEALKDARCLTDRGYKYGSAWLSDPVPAAVLKRLDALMTELDGKRLGIAPNVDDAPEVSETSDILDSRDVIKRLEIYREAVTVAGIDPDAERDSIDEPEDEDARGLWEEYCDLRDLEGQCNYGDWRYGVTLVRGDYFTDFAKEEAESLDLIKSDTRWPGNHIDWESAAAELKQDYSEVTFKGETFYIRN